ncbi:hypothetical protein [uncultured Roseobacter sp.]|uniref:hypothetical protein n=1 Tax=uncultured Roseobacter sp. TaxID=114847 RepID=UPI0026053437|nr:hypothetical protein [uncultured Roseobacter sp.]
MAALGRPHHSATGFPRRCWACPEVGNEPSIPACCIAANGSFSAPELSDEHRTRSLLRQSTSIPKATFKGVETFRAIRKRHFAGCERGVTNEISFVRDLFDACKKTS